MYVQRASVQRGGLGLLPVVAVPAFLQSLNSALSIFGLNSSDPAKDKIRIANINQAFSLAVAGNTTPQSNLDMLTGEAYLHQIANNAPVAGGGTAGGSQIAIKAAQAALVELAARRGATTVIGGLLPVSTIPATVTGTITQVAKSPVVLLGGAAILLYMISKRRR